MAERASPVAAGLNQSPQPSPVDQQGIRFEQVGKAFPDGTRAVQNISFRVPEGSVGALIGPSGSGKTTLLRLAAGLLSPDTGSIQLGHLRATDHALPKGQIGYVFQESCLLPWLNALDNIALPLRLIGTGREEARRQARQKLIEMGLADKAQSFPDELSGGMKMRVSIARALVAKPRWVFLDEPFGALDALTRDYLNEWLRELQETQKWTGLLVTHSASEAVFLAHSVHILEGQPGTLQHSFDNPRRACSNEPISNQQDSPLIARIKECLSQTPMRQA